MLYKIVRDRIEQNKNLRESGGYVGIPVPFTRLQDYLPSLEQGHSIGILGGTGTGKSRFARYFSIYAPYKFYKDTGYKLKIFYLPLEDSKEKVYMNLICHYLNDIYGYKVSLQELQSKGSRILPQIIMDAIYEAEDFFSEFEDIVTILDGYSDPKSIYTVLESYLLDPEVGYVDEYEVDVKGRKEKQTRYVPLQHVILLLDNYSNIDLDDSHETERAAVQEMAKKYVRGYLCNFYKVTAIQVLQTDFATERAQYGSDGKAIMSKVEPNLASIGDVKTISRSMHIIMSLFDPSKFDFLTYPQVSQKQLKEDPEAIKKVYNIDVLGNKFRALKVLKNNDGDTGVRIGLYFDAITENFTELPSPESSEMQRWYDQFKKKGLDTPVKTNRTLETYNEGLFDEDPF